MVCCAASSSSGSSSGEGHSLQSSDAETSEDEVFSDTRRPWARAQGQPEGFFQGLADVEPDELEEGRRLPGQARDGDEAARLVRLHQDEILLQSFGCWLICFSIIMFLLFPVMAVILCWMIWEAIVSRNAKCNAPLHMWAAVVFANCLIALVAPKGSRIERFICCWPDDDLGSQRPPLRVQLWNLLNSLFTFVWNCYGIYLILKSDGDPSHHPPHCKDVLPDFYRAVKVYASLSMTYTLFMYINLIGFVHVLQLLMNRGMLQTSNRAPKGSLERNTTVVPPGDPALNDQCSVCMSPFSTGTTVKTKRCQHLFHKKCLQHWLNVNRTCPLCRDDLGYEEE
eukprot:TRINITY_DN20234_c0_g1_i2.p1 TRINITY_DN20234_c0_g1~~TRINITY_DN20234_c0_g1_i2.p1  ORF type:complete len:353 (-),score=43.52 TRINITY_DN20234_c0_g1_i2:71-1087(-)